MNEASIKGHSQAAGRRSHGGQDCTDRVSQQQHFQEPLTRPQVSSLVLCRTCWMAQVKPNSWGQSSFFRVSPIVTPSSLMKAGTVDDLREFSKRVHVVHILFCLCCTWSRLLWDAESGNQGFWHGINPGEELGQGRDSAVSALQPLSLVS